MLDVRFGRGVRKPVHFGPCQKPPWKKSASQRAAVFLILVFRDHRTNLMHMACRTWMFWREDDDSDILKAFQDDEGEYVRGRSRILNA